MLRKILTTILIVSFTGIVPAHAIDEIVVPATIEVVASQEVRAGVKKIASSAAREGAELIASNLIARHSIKLVRLFWNSPAGLWFREGPVVSAVEGAAAAAAARLGLAEVSGATIASLAGAILFSLVQKGDALSPSSYFDAAKYDEALERYRNRLWASYATDPQFVNDIQRKFQEGINLLQAKLDAEKIPRLKISANRIFISMDPRSSVAVTQEDGENGFIFEIPADVLIAPNYAEEIAVQLAAGVSRDIPYYPQHAITHRYLKKFWVVTPGMERNVEENFAQGLFGRGLPTEAQISTWTKTYQTALDNRPKAELTVSREEFEKGTFKIATRDVVIDFAQRHDEVMTAACVVPHFERYFSGGLKNCDLTSVPWKVALSENFVSDLNNTVRKKNIDPKNEGNELKWALESGAVWGFGGMASDVAMNLIFKRYKFFLTPEVASGTMWTLTWLKRSFKYATAGAVLGGIAGAVASKKATGEVSVTAVGMGAAGGAAIAGRMWRGFPYRTFISKGVWFTITGFGIYAFMPELKIAKVINYDEHGNVDEKDKNAVYMLSEYQLRVRHGEFKPEQASARVIAELQKMGITLSEIHGEGRNYNIMACMKEYEAQTEEAALQHCTDKVDESYK